MPKTATDDLYETDFYEWTRAQAEGLRLIARERPNLPLDLPRLIEEVEDLGKSERDTVHAHLGRVIEHCLKLEHSLSMEPRGVWKRSVDGAREVIGRKITPSLRRDASRALPRLYAAARKAAVRGLEEFAEFEEADSMPSACPYTLDHLLQDEWFPANLHGVSDRRRT